MNGINEICVCGHDISTHFEDRERPGEHREGAEPKRFRGACLGMHCDGCRRYRSKDAPTGILLKVIVSWVDGTPMEFSFPAGSTTYTVVTLDERAERRKYAQATGDSSDALERLFGRK